MDRKNLTVLCGAYVHRVEMDNIGGALNAREVEFEYGGSIHRVRANKEIVLSAG